MRSWREATYTAISIISLWDIDIYDLKRPMMFRGSKTKKDKCSIYAHITFFFFSIFYKQNEIENSDLTTDCEILIPVMYRLIREDILNKSFLNKIALNDV